MRSIALVALLAMVSGCASPRMVKRDGNNFTLCCSYCSDKAWTEKLAVTCPGATLKGEELVERASGLETVEQRSEDKRSRTTITQVKRETEVCRQYTCNGSISGGVSQY